MKLNWKPWRHFAFNTKQNLSDRKALFVKIRIFNKKSWTFLNNIICLQLFQIQEYKGINLAEENQNVYREGHESFKFEKFIALFIIFDIKYSMHIKLLVSETDWLLRWVFRWNKLK